MDRDHNGGSDQVVLQARRLSKTFVGRRVLDAVDFELRGGEVHALLGQNGSGKSTLIKILAGFHAPDHGGELEVGEREVTLPLAPSDPARLGISFVHQDLALVPELTVGESILVGRYPTGLGWRLKTRTERSRVRKLLDRFGLDLSTDAEIGTLSEVDRAQVAIVRAFDRLEEVDGRVLVLDEPTAYLPRDGVDNLFSAIRRVTAEGVGVVLVTHRLDEVRVLCDRVTVLRDGRLIETARVSDRTESELIERIVGSSLDRLYPEGRPVRGELAMTVSGACGPGVSDVSFEIGSGEIVGLTGLLGSGFEETVHLLFGATTATAGTVNLGGKDLELRNLTPHRAIAAGVALIPGNRLRDGAAGAATVAENVTLASLSAYGSRWRLKTRRESAAAQAIVEDFDVVPPDATRVFATLSGGNQQKALLGKWFTKEPAVLLLHDPTRGIDIGAKRQVFQRLRDAADRGAALVIASPEYEDLAHLCDRVLVFYGGSLVAEMHGNELTKERITERCYAAGRDGSGNPSQTAANEQETSTERI